MPCSSVPPVRDRDREDAGTPRGWGDTEKPRKRPRKGKRAWGRRELTRTHQLRPPAAHVPRGTSHPSRAPPVPLEMPMLAAAPTETRTQPGLQRNISILSELQENKVGEERRKGVVNKNNHSFTWFFLLERAAEPWGHSPGGLWVPNTPKSQPRRV